MNEFKALVRTAERYLDGSIKGDGLVSFVDEFVSSDRVYDLPEKEQILVQELQDQLALYVSDPRKRAQFDGYLSDMDLRILVEQFVSGSRSTQT